MTSDFLRFRVASRLVRNLCMSLTAQHRLFGAMMQVVDSVNTTALKRVHFDCYSLTVRYEHRGLVDLLRDHRRSPKVCPSIAGKVSTVQKHKEL